MMLFIIFVALIGLLFLIASLINGINFPLLSGALFFFTGSAVLYAARRSRKPPENKPPGMAATEEIHQGTRSVMEYLLSPVQRVAMEAGRER